MNIEIVHTDLNQYGGAEQVAVAMMEALSDLGYRFEITTATNPSFTRLERAFGERVKCILPYISRINVVKLPRLDDDYYCCSNGSNSRCDDRLVINTHGDILPYHEPSFSRNNAITYCHYPLLHDMLSDDSKPYPNYLYSRGTIPYGVLDNRAEKERISNSLLRKYHLMLAKTYVITNSEFSMKAINDLCGSSFHATILPPPVNVDDYCNLVHLDGNDSYRDDYVLVISRIHPSKKIENAVLLARLLKEAKIGKGMTIAGNISEEDGAYLLRLKNMIHEYGVSDYVSIQTSVEIKKLQHLTRKSKAYFHLLPREPFGISVAEAMSAGIVPVVPDSGGQTEFVPARYQYHDLNDAALLISKALKAPESERLAISNSIKRFSRSNFIQCFKQVIQDMMPDRIKLDAKLVSASR